MSGENFTTANTSDLQTLLYLPLYWYGDKGKASIDYPLSIGNPPVYSDGDRVVTITLKHYAWSDGEIVSARDVGFWINLLKANKADWANYVPGGFPDNVVSWRRSAAPPSGCASTPATTRPGSPITSSRRSRRCRSRGTGPRCPQPSRRRTRRNLPDTTSTGAKAVYSFLNGQATKTTGYASSPLWSVVDGPWRLASLTSDGMATFVPNRRYSGPDRPHLAKFVELPFTSAKPSSRCSKPGRRAAGQAAPASRSRSATCPTTTCRSSPR